MTISEEHISKITDNLLEEISEKQKELRRIQKKCKHPVKYRTEIPCEDGSWACYITFKCGLCKKEWNKFIA